MEGVLGGLGGKSKRVFCENGNPLSRFRRVFEPELHALPTPPMVDLNPTGQMKTPAAMPDQSATDRAVEGSERDRVHARTHTIAKGQLEMPAADLPAMVNGHVGKCEARGRGALSKRPGSLEFRNKFNGCGTRHERSVQSEIPGAAIAGSLSC